MGPSMTRGPSRQAPGRPVHGQRSRSWSVACVRPSWASHVRLSPMVHEQGRCDFVGLLVEIARAKGLSGFLGDGSNRWPSVHRLDAAYLFRRAVVKAPAGSVLHGVGEEGVPIGAVVEVIGRHLKVPVSAIPAEDAGLHFGFQAAIIGRDMPASNPDPRTAGLAADPPGLLDDLDNAAYFDQLASHPC